LPALVVPANRRLPPTAMPKLFADEKGLFWADATATVTIAPDDSQTDCHPGSASITRGSYVEYHAKADLTLDLCGLLKESTQFRHALGADGLPQASVLQISATLSRMPAVLAPPPPPMSAATSGHILDESGKWADNGWWLQQFSIVVPNWTGGLIDQANLPKDAQVGVLLNLKPNAGAGTIDACNVVRPSGHARLDKATCWALSFGNYSERYIGFARSGAEGYPVMVQWHGAKAEIGPLPDPELPHMPKDVPLKPADRPAGAQPTQPVVQLHIDLDPTGHATGCKVMATSGTDAWDAASCRLSLERARFTAARDWFGRPARGLYQLQVDWPAMAIRPAH